MLVQYSQGFFHQPPSPPRRGGYDKKDKKFAPCGAKLLGEQFRGGQVKIVCPRLFHSLIQVIHYTIAVDRLAGLQGAKKHSPRDERAGEKNKLDCTVFIAMGPFSCFVIVF